MINGVTIVLEVGVDKFGQGDVAEEFLEGVVTALLFGRAPIQGTLERLASRRMSTPSPRPDHEIPPGAVVPKPGLEVSPTKRRIVLISALSLFVLGTVGSNVGPALVDEHPVWVLLLSARNRNLLFSVPYMDPLPWVVIGFFRILLAATALYLLGRLYGTKAASWVEREVGEMPAIWRWLEKAIDRAGPYMLILMPASNLVQVMAGHREVPARKFFACVSTGIALKLTVLWFGGQAFREQIEWFLKAINRYQWYIVAALFAVSFIQIARKSRGSLDEIVDEIETPDGIIEPHGDKHLGVAQPAED